MIHKIDLIDNLLNGLDSIDTFLLQKDSIKQK